MRQMSKYLLAAAAALTLSAQAFAGVVQDKILVIEENNLPPVSLIDQAYMVQDSFKNAPEVSLTNTVMQVEYNPAVTYRVPTRVGAVTTFQFEEPILTHIQAVGNDIFNSGPFLNTSADLENGESITIDTLQYIQPLSPNKDTTLTFYSKEGRIYNFYIYSVGRESEELPVVTVYVRLPDALKEPVIEKQQKAVDESRIGMSDAAKKIHFEGENAFTNYMSRILPGKVNTQYKMYGGEEAGYFQPWAVFDDGSRTYFNFDGVLPSNEIPAIFKVTDNIDIPQLKKDAFTLDESFKGWVYVDNVSQEGWTLRIGDRHLCIKPTVDLREYHIRGRSLDYPVKKKKNYSQMDNG